MGKSKLQIPKICSFCGNSFLAKTVKTMYCSHQCAWTASNEKKKQERKLRVQTELLNNIKAQEIDYITIPQALQIFTASRSTIRRLILTNRIEYRKISPRKTFVGVKSLEVLFPLRPKPLIAKKKENPLVFDLAPEHCYTIGEISERFKVTESSVYKHIRQFSIPIRQIGNYVYAPKKEIDRLYNNKAARE